MAQNSKWSLNLCTVKGIPVKVHLSFFILLAWVGYEESAAGGDAFSEVLLVVALFLCVLLHEIGHAITARYFGLRTRDIILYPFGGVASLIDEPKPKAEFFMTIAGPLVNLIIAAALFPLTSFEIVGSHLKGLDFIGRLFLANVALFIFNMIPAFPMDGGRILRSLMALLGIQSATAIATRISQVLSILLAAFALYSWNPILVIISLLVFSNAMREHTRDRSLRAAQGFKVKDVMTDVAQLVVFHHGLTVSQALNLALKSMQNAFPVMYGENILGVLHKQDLIEAAATNPDEAYISEITSRTFLALSPEADLVAITEALQSTPSDVWLVMHSGQLVGMLTRESLFEFLMVHGIRKRMKDSASALNEEDQW